MKNLTVLHTVRTVALLPVIFFVAIFFFPSTVNALSMVTRFEGTDGNGGGSGSPDITSSSFTPSSNSLLVVVFSGVVETNGVAPTDISGGGLTWTERVNEEQTAGGWTSWVTIWTAPVTTGSSMTVNATYDDVENHNGSFLGVYEFTGYDTSTPVRQVKSAPSGAFSGTYSMTLDSAPLSTSAVLATMMSNTRNEVGTAPSGWTEEYRDEAVGSETQAQVQTRTGSISTTVSWSSVDTEFSHVVASVEITAAPTSVLIRPPNNLGLVGYWSFNDATSTKATDFSGNGYHITFPGGTENPVWTNGKRGSALFFDASDDYLGTPSITVGSNVMTVSFWLKWDSFASDCDFVILAGDFETPVLGSYGITPNDCDGSSAFLFHLYGNSGRRAESIPRPTAGVWRHYVAVFDNSTSAGDITVYADGVAQSTTLVSNTKSGSGNIVTGEHYIMGFTQAPFYSLGKIDELRIYNRALGASEAVALYRAGATRQIASSKTLTNGSTLGPGGGLVGHWSFDGGDVNWTSDTTGVAYDGSGNNNTGTITNMTRTTAVAIGKLGQALVFDNTNDYVDAGSAASLNITGAITLTAWVKKNSLGALDTIVMKGHETDDELQYALFTESGEIAYAFCGGTDASCAVLDHRLTSTDASLQTGVWYHLAATYDDSANNIALYLNGRALSETISVGSPETSSMITSTNTLRIGRYYSGSEADSVIDDVRVYSRPLSAAEVLQLYRLGQATINP